MPTSRSRDWRTGVIAILAGAAALIALGVLTLGVQASVRPHHLPLAVALAAGSSLDPLALRIAGQGGDAVRWQVVDPAHAAQLLDDKDIYGYLTLSPARGGRGVTVDATESGALVPTATQAADGVLRAAGAAIAAQAGQVGTLAVRTVHPTSIAAKVLPLAAATLLWIGGLVSNGLLLLAGRRTARRPSATARLLLVLGNAVLGTALVFTFSKVWDGGIAWNWSVAWFLILVGGSFAAVQGAVLRLLGAAGLPLLGLLYLMAPSVSGQPPELLHPAYRDGLWSWSPIRIASEATRSLLYLNTTPNDVVVGWVVFALVALVALLVLLWPSSRPANGGAPEDMPNRPSRRTFQRSSSSPAAGGNGPTASPAR